MQTIKHFNRATILTLVTIGLAGIQAYLNHTMTTCYVHEYFSIYFFIELFVFLITIFSGLKRKAYVIIYLLVFLFESSWYFIHERPISSDDMLMQIVGVIRIYIIVWLLKRFVRRDQIKSNEMK